MPFAFLDPGPLLHGDLSLTLIERYPGDPARNWVPAYRFEMRRAGASARAGNIELRVGDTDYLKLYFGHIGYSVQPEYRGARYAARACKLILPLARRHGFREIWITCNPDNWASRRTCEIAGGEFVEIVDLPEDIDMYREGERRKCRYRFRI
jgi:predicted acetyltransferase